MALFIFIILIRLYFESFFVATASFTISLFVLPITAMLLSTGFGIKFIGVWHSFAIYLVLAKSTNDMIVIMDIWR